MAKWFQRKERPVHEHVFGKKPKKGVMVLQGETATATRAIVSQVHGQLPHIEFKFYIRHGYDPEGQEEFDEVWITLPLEEAGKLLDQGLSSFQAAMPRIPGMARRTQYGE